MSKDMSTVNPLRNAEHQDTPAIESAKKSEPEDVKEAAKAFEKAVGDVPMSTEEVLAARDAKVAADEAADEIVESIMKDPKVEDFADKLYNLIAEEDLSDRLSINPEISILDESVALDHAGNEIPFFDDYIKDDSNNKFVIEPTSP